MDYPPFLVPTIGGSWLIGGNAILHVIIAHFAVGGGLLVVLTEQLARRRGDALWLGFARRQSAVLVLLSTVLGALTGVGIWFTIGLVQPAATASLIHNFVWGWAIE
jgi:cytochrome bd-type quinol oxidase subunit 1